MTYIFNFFTQFNAKNKALFFLSVLLLCCACENTPTVNKITVNTEEELNNAITKATPGDEIILANGAWKDIQIQFYGTGTKDAPIVLKAETPGDVFIEGASNLQIGGTYLEVRDLYFKNGYTPTRNVIQFGISKDSIANHCKVTHCVIEEFTQPNRDDTDHWVEFWGRHNELSNCYITGKSNFGPTIMVQLKGNQHIKNYHQIINNHFGPRPRKGGPHGETMQIGDSGTSMAPSHTYVANNLFERCNGEVEIISSKSNYNEFRNNVFFESEGSLVLRHGNYATIDGNVFIGNDNSEFIGGIRVINTGHWITNNYFYKLKGSMFRAPLAVMNGIPKSPQNRYLQVTDAVIAHNTYVDCVTPFHFSVGSNVSQSDVLPKSEIRSARPTRTTVANNLIFSHEGGTYPIKNYDKVDGVLFKNNILNVENKSDVKPKGILTKSFKVNKISDVLFVPTENDKDVYYGFDFETITTDLFGNKRTSENNSVGAIVNPVKDNAVLVDKTKYGTDWFSIEKEKYEPKTISVATNQELLEHIKSVNSGDILSLKSGSYAMDTSLVIDKKVTITSQDKNNKAELVFTSNHTAFEMNPKGNLIIEDIVLRGNNTQDAFATLDKNMTKAYNLWVKNSEISHFKNVLSVSKGSFADTVSVSNSIIKDCIRGIQLNKETNDKGDYNAAFVYITNSTFDNINETALDYYRGGYDESTIGGNLKLQNNTFTNCGKDSKDHILIKNRGIVNVDFSNNTFTNNPVKVIAVLWGEKGQKPVDNVIKNSGEIKVVQNLKLKLMY
ncbi:chondroitinase-B domain-containing protein [Flavivirga jejuensis]|uniref:Chondroitinase-B domain-containing protein n=1 Tax=Flavivirga jejuensis TaxID=870487 RepID=A0ABT8WJV3_9FLAO|nr:chondroitinase-B domain-containing protein [Flavivirga jejuensis]MDO5973429.1 chondroitinase-B domain-containing protein [Flavivirga jejuensis]